MKLILFIIFTLSSYVFLFPQSKSTEIVDMSEIIHGLKVDIKYATKYNFTQQKLYTIGKAFGTIPMAKSLKLINDSLSKEGLGIIILDAYRPRVIQWLLWEITPDSEFVADPRKGSRHNRGSAVDLTLYDIKTGEELEMPTPFDEFSERASHNYQHLPEEVKRNRDILKNIMTKNGFNKYDAEWWHYNHIESLDFPLRDFQMR
jgi:D-alanyl-D-alanine dipeptidase